MLCVRWGAGLWSSGRELRRGCETTRGLEGAGTLGGNASGVDAIRLCTFVVVWVKAVVAAVLLSGVEISALRTGIREGGGGDLTILARRAARTVSGSGACCGEVLVRSTRARRRGEKEVAGGVEGRSDELSSRITNAWPPAASAFAAFRGVETACSDRGASVAKRCEADGAALSVSMRAGCGGRRGKAGGLATGLGAKNACRSAAAQLGMRLLTEGWTIDSIRFRISGERSEGPKNLPDKVRWSGPGRSQDAYPLTQSKLGKRTIDLERLPVQERLVFRLLERLNGDSQSPYLRGTPKTISLTVRPTTISYIVTPRAKTSLRRSSWTAPFARSGLRYSVPARSASARGSEAQEVF